MANLGDSDAPVDVKLRLLLLGESKAGKTWWAMQAARKYNVLYINGDVALQTINDRVNGLPPEAKRNIEFLDVSDYVDEKGEYIAAMAKFFVALTTEGVVTWNDTKGRLFDKKDYERITSLAEGEEDVPVSGDRVIQIKPARLTPDTMVIVDSWTTLVTSIQAWKAGDLGIDLLDVEKLERDMYTGTGHKATQFLQLLRAFPCHLCVIGHPREYVKRSPPPGSKGQVAEKDMKIDWTKMVPHSTSNPHALTMGKNFSDIGWVEINAMNKRIINFTPTNDRVVGGHFEGKEEVDKFTILDLIQRIGGSVPTTLDSTPWLTRFGPGEFVPAGNRPAPTLNQAPAGSTVQATAPRGLAGLSGLKLKGAAKI